jgi:hypothetical protein
MMQVEEPPEAQDFVIICKNASPNINYSQLLHDNEFRNNPELSNKEVGFRGKPNPDNPGSTKIKMTIEVTAAKVTLVVKHLKENLCFFRTRRSPKRKLTPRFNLPKKLTCMSLLRNND